MIYTVTHTTIYTYSEPAALSQNELTLFPRPTPTQDCGSSHIAIYPRPSFLDLRTDYYGNQVHSFMVQHSHEKLEITATSEVTTHPLPLPAPGAGPNWEAARDTRTSAAPNPGHAEAVEFAFPSAFITPSPAFAEFARDCFPAGKPLLAGALDLTSKIYEQFEYTKNATTIGTPLEEVMKNRRGVCQDFAHLEIACLRSLGLCARYVSGYLETLPPPGKEKLKGADASHAWLSLFVPTLGWVDLDPTNNMIPGERHITLAWGRDYADVTPVKGMVWGGGTHKLQVSVDVMPKSCQPIGIQ